eukprot:CAMPEP_0173416806 /NCGR_PEP_ID=MMETSP1356-20130122/85578_1 /TAXON_ID=77927 ORGANISM="Hemiselmis virescens, Strain PCC157" /NCGR_SAMPLE_ID=MMETSP1356 /ASSEMBLY_ACC=CAM_ASM_000847 /LENGTH=159 /DNA_ID=CAMNT_0014379123 /DNA_START=1157 /DNA_END=1634 /DNA_ORIENTATION=+
MSRTASIKNTAAHLTRAQRVHQTGGEPRGQPARVPGRLIFGMYRNGQLEEAPADAPPHPPGGPPTRRNEPNVAQRLGRSQAVPSNPAQGMAERRVREAAVKETPPPPPPPINQGWTHAKKATLRPPHRKGHPWVWEPHIPRLAARFLLLSRHPYTRCVW